jgi:primosomal protein N' (replication factor Y)
MVAQGFNFPGVTLVGVIDADGPLHIPDFRSAERTFQLIAQVAGRAGRDMVTGEVIVQTRHPEHDALTSAAQLDYKRFAQSELLFRRDLNYPPFSRLIRVITQSKKPDQARKDIDALAEWVAQLELEFPVGILGPTTVKKDLQVLLKVPLPTFSGFLPLFREFIAQKYNRYWIDVDPV